MKNRKGFTIVELVIVIAVIAILAAVLIPTFAGVIGKANESSALQTARSTLTNALNMSSTATLAGQDSVTKIYKTVFLVDGYAYGYTGNELVGINYPGYKGEATLKSSGTSKNFNAIMIASENLKTVYSPASGTAVAGTRYYTISGENYVVTEVEAGTALADGTYTATYTLDDTITNIILGNDQKAMSATTDFVGTLTVSVNDDGNYEVSDGTHKAVVYLNSDFSKKVIVFTTFGG